MPLLLDAYNILHVVGVLPPDLAGIDLDELADLVAGSRYRHEPAILVCDGPARRHRVEHPSVHVRFAGPGRTADDLIVRLVGRSTAPRRVTVVTSDREIIQTVRRRRATVIESDRFLGLLAEDHATARPEVPSGSKASPRHLVDQRQVEAWLRLFDLDPEWTEIPASGPPLTPNPATPPPPMPPAREKPRPRVGKPVAPMQPRPGRPAIEAERLADIDPHTVDDLDTESLLDTDRRDDRVDGNPDAS